MYLSIAQGHDGLPCVVDAVTGEFVDGVQELKVERPRGEVGKKIAFATLKVVIRDRDWAILSANKAGLKRIENVFYEFGNRSIANHWQGGSELVSHSFPDALLFESGNKTMPVEGHPLNNNITTVEVRNIKDLNQSLISQELAVHRDGVFSQIISGEIVGLQGVSSEQFAVIIDCQNDLFHQFHVHTHDDNSTLRPRPASTLLQEQANSRFVKHLEQVAEYAVAREVLRQLVDFCTAAQLPLEGFDPIHMGM